MRITESQRAVLDTLRCERLSSDASNFRAIDDFENYRNCNVSDSLKNEAYSQDEDGRVAYYVVKDQENRILFFFSLKSGALFDSFLEAEKLERIKRLYDYMIAYAREHELSVEENGYIQSFMEEIRAKKTIKKEVVARILQISKDDEDLDEIFDESLKSVGKTYAGVEMVHFCANDCYRHIWDSFQLPQKVGVVIFWLFTVPIVEKMMQFVGCEYLYLFAADLTLNMDLVAYYKDKLGFCSDNSHTVVRPIYDFACKFMYQETRGINERRQMFFDSFNPDEDAV